MPFHKDGWSYCFMFWNETSILNAITTLRFYKNFHYHTVFIKWQKFKKTANYIYLFTYFFKYRRNMLFKSKFRINLNCTQYFSVKLDSTKAPQKKFFSEFWNSKEGGFFQSWLSCDCCKTMWRPYWMLFAIQK